MRKRKLIIGILMLLFYFCFFGVAGAVPHNFEDTSAPGNTSVPFADVANIGAVQGDSTMNNTADDVLHPGGFFDVGPAKEDCTQVVENILKSDVAPIGKDCIGRENEMGKFHHHKDKDDRGDENPTAPVPEPATMLLLGAGLAGVATFKRLKVK